MRILLAAHDVEPALELLGALEDAGHRIEHVFDLEEGLLRAAIAWPDAVVCDVGAEGVDVPMLRRWTAERDIPLVLTYRARSTAEGTRDGWGSHGLGESIGPRDLGRLARRLGAVAFERPDTDDGGERGWHPAFVDVVETAVRNAAHDPPTDEDTIDPPTPRKRSGTVEVPRVVLMAARGQNAVEVISALVRSSLGVRCVCAHTAADALAALQADPRIKAVLLDRRLSVEPEGRDLHDLVAARAMPIVQVRVAYDDDPTSVGRTAWEVIPALRRALAARRAKVG